MIVPSEPQLVGPTNPIVATLDRMKRKVVEAENEALLRFLRVNTVEEARTALDSLAQIGVALAVERDDQGLALGPGSLEAHVDQTVTFRFVSKDSA